MSSQSVTLDKPNIPKSPSSLFQRFWLAALIGLGVGATVAWTSLLGYGLFKLVEMAL